MIYGRVVVMSYDVLKESLFRVVLVFISPYEWGKSLYGFVAYLAT